LLRLRSFANQFIRASEAERVAAWWSLLWGLIVVVVIGWIASQVFSLLITVSNARHLQFVPVLLPSFVLFWAFWMLVFSGLTVAIQHLYTQRDLNLLLAAPLTPRSVFLLKFVDIAISNSGLFALTGGPVFAAYAWTQGYVSAEYLTRGIIVLVAFSTVPSAIGALAAMVVLRILPAGRMRELLGALAIVVLSMGYLGLNMAVYGMQDPLGAARGVEAFAQVVQSPVVNHGPWAWAGSVVATPTGYPEAYEAGLLVLATSILTVVVTAEVAARLHWRGWMESQEALRAGAVMAFSDRRGEVLFRYLPPPVRGFLLKDLRTLTRDMRQLSLLLLPVVVVAVFLMNVRQVPEIRSTPPLLLSLSLIPLVAMIAVRVATSAFIAESRALWGAFASPAPVRAILVGKLIYAVLLTAPLSLLTIAAYAILYNIGSEAWLLLLLMTLITDIALCAVSVGAAAYRMELTQDGAVISLSTTSRILTLLIQVGYGFILSAICVIGWILVRIADWPRVAAYFLTGLAILAVSALAMTGSLEIGARRLKQLEL